MRLYNNWIYLYIYIQDVPIIDVYIVTGFIYIYIYMSKNYNPMKIPMSSLLEPPLWAPVVLLHDLRSTLRKEFPSLQVFLWAVYP